MRVMVSVCEGEGGDCSSAMNEGGGICLVQ